MTGEEIKTLIDWARKQGIRRIKTAEIEVEFAEQEDAAASADMMRVLENGIEQGREEIMRHLTPEHRARVDQQLEQDIITGSS